MVVRSFRRRMKISLIRPLLTRWRWRGGFSTTTSSDKMVASVLFERLHVVIPKIDPIVYAFQEFSYVFFVYAFYFIFILN
jgi:large subunit ribosomal protein L46